ncbi:ISEfa8, transposase [Listeria cornellensis FSL F6-0969]|uniref:ISEfa8, transposase n=1 Tax=Listeria cornellensis FSL F6-0969 TaxID=1265820 RepID=W7CI78_9LIST|nr:ISEfa8, transposase [Listeria cornellensis FSL F6-0969]
MTKKMKRTFTSEFKKQIVALYESGRPRKAIIDNTSALDKWIHQSRTTGSFQAKDNLPSEQKVMQELRNRNTQLEMENDILKQAALIFGRKSK